jgi:hypothetical protein
VGEPLQWGFFVLGDEDGNGGSKTTLQFWGIIPDFKRLINFY